jgi:hypothetical protein
MVSVLSIVWFSLTFIYCTVHVYVVNHFCDCMCCFRVESNLCRFFYSLFIYVLPLEIQLSEGGVGTPLTGLTPHSFVSVPSKDLDVQLHVVCSVSDRER